MARILVIEDNPANMKLASLLLRHAGHTVLCAVDAESGLMAARSELPDLILMDIQLPDMDGLAATALLKKNSVTANIPVIALTAMAMKADQEKSQMAGCEGYITKPLRYQELYAVINRFLNLNEIAFDTPATSKHPEQVVSETPQVSLTPATNEEENGGDRLILVAEDNVTNQKLILRQLALLGFAANAVANGALALQRWQTGKYALLITDLQMPELDGFGLAATIRMQEQGAARIPIVALTANVLRGEAERCRMAGMDDYLNKPMQLAELKACLEKWLPATEASELKLPYAGSPMAHSKVLDVQVLERLVGNDPQVIQSFLRDFQSSAIAISHELTAACAGQDAEQAARQAHKLISSARAVGALKLAEVCEEIQSAGKAGNTEKMSALMPLFEQAFDNVCASLDTALMERQEQ